MEKIMLDWKEVDSSFVDRIAHDADTNNLYVVLDHGSYLYNGVPVSVFERFLEASSKGRFFNLKIKDVYTFTQI